MAKSKKWHSQRTRKVKLSTFDSKDGIGAVLLKAEGKHCKPVAYASRTVTEAEQHYAQIEKEYLSLDCGLKWFITISMVNQASL